jgi:hypothetical protein
VARAWLSEWIKRPNNNNNNDGDNEATTVNLNLPAGVQIKRLVTLGSPHNPPPTFEASESSNKFVFDQTRGLFLFYYHAHEYTILIYDLSFIIYHLPQVF